MSTKIHPFDRCGTWTSSHNFYYRCAYQALDEFSKLTGHLIKTENDIQNHNKQLFPQDLSMILYSEAYGIIQECYRELVSLKLFSCLTIEAFVNYYGTRRLGKEYYESNYERQPIIKKLSKVMDVCQSIDVSQHVDLVSKLQYLFDERNDLVHPKSTDVGLDSINYYENKHPKSIQANEHIQRLESILDSICSLDSSIVKKYEFYLW